MLMSRVELSTHSDCDSMHKTVKAQAWSGRGGHKVPLPDEEPLVFDNTGRGSMCHLV